MAKKEFILTDWIEPIIDRSQDDINTLLVYKELGYFNLSQEQQKNWKLDLKGALNYSDLQRIGSNIALIQYLIKNNIKYKDREKLLPLNTLYPSSNLYPKFNFNFIERNAI